MGESPEVHIQRAEQDGAVAVVPVIEARPAANRDRATAGLTGSLLLLGVISASGFEVQAIVNGPAPAWALAMIGGFISLVLILAVVIARRGGAQSEISRPPRQLERAIQKRALALGGPRGLNIRVLADVDGPKDAYCIGIGKAVTVYISPRLAADLDSQDAKARVAAELLLDRALVDAATGGRATLAIAKACVISALVFLPVKFLLIAVLWPRGGDDPEPGLMPVSAATGGIIYLATTLAMGVFLFLLYRHIVRRRAFQLDGAAVAVSADSDQARMILEEEVQEWTFGLHGKTWVRPGPRARIAALTDTGAINGVTPPGPFSLALILMALMVLLQITIAGPTPAIAGDAVGAMSAISLIAFSFVFATLLTLDEDTGFRPWRMVAYAFVMAFGLAAALWSALPVTGGRIDPDGMDGLREAARIEIILLVLSMPVALAALIIGQILAQKFFQAELDSLEGRFVSAGAGAVAAGFILWGVMLAVWHPHQAYLEARFQAYDAYLVDEASSFYGVGVTPEEWLAGQRQQAAAMADASAFHPPLSALMLWQSPLKVDP